MNTWLNIITENTKKIHLLSWKILNEINALITYVILRDIIKQIYGCYNKICDGTYDISGKFDITIIIIIN